jgi:molybdopterin-guanine dinucleotide biosynthesis protein A
LSELLIKSKSLSVRDYLERVNTHVVDLSKDDEMLKSYTNTNTPFEIEDLTKKTKSKKRKESGDWFA